MVPFKPLPSGVITSHFSHHQHPEMDVQENEGSSALKGAAKVFAKRWLELSWQIEGVPGFITTTHRDECSLCEQYAEHAVVASEKPMVEIPSHRIELAFRTAWPWVVEHIEDNALDEAHWKLSWYRDRYQDTVKNAKSLHVRNTLILKGDYWSQ